MISKQVAQWGVGSFPVVIISCQIQQEHGSDKQEEVKGILETILPGLHLSRIYPGSFAVHWTVFLLWHGHRHPAIFMLGLLDSGPLWETLSTDPHF